VSNEIRIAVLLSDQGRGDSGVPPARAPVFDPAFRAAAHAALVGSRGDTINPGSPHLATKSLSARLRAKRSEMMLSELEAVALRLFVERGFGDVTIEEIAAEAHISVRTFYRYFPAKEDVLQLRIDRRSEALRAALYARPAGEPPLHSLRLALEEMISAEDTDLLKCWTAVINDTPSVLRAVVGGIQLKRQHMIAEFFGSRLGLPGHALVPTMLAAAAEGVMQAAQAQWFLQGGNSDLVTAMSESLAVLERAIGSEPGISYRIKAAGD
jgi:TetR/AcrR family transcriptional regulator, regulator of mycofactocin system